MTVVVIPERASEKGTRRHKELRRAKGAPSVSRAASRALNCWSDMSMSKFESAHRRFSCETVPLASIMSRNVARKCLKDSRSFRRIIMSELESGLPPIAREEAVFFVLPITSSQNFL